MGHGHTHRRSSGTDEQVQVSGTARTVVLVVLAVIGLGTVAGLVVWWPEGDAARQRAAAAEGAASFAVRGATYLHGEVVALSDPCAPDRTGAAGCGTMRVDLDEYGVVESTAPPQVVAAGLQVGDRVELLRVPAGDGGEERYIYSTVDRDPTLLWLFGLFLVAVLLVARWRGLFALVGLAFGGAVVWWFILPALLSGQPGVGVALAGASAIMFVVLYTTHGFSMRTSTALLGTILGILLVTLLGVLAVSQGRLSASDEDASLLSAFASDLDFQSLLGCALVIAGLGVLNDVTITQASAVWELRAAAPTASRRTVFSRAMRIGRDHIASTIYTIVFAYVGTALVVLMLLQIYDRPLVELLSSDLIAEEIVRTLTASIGLVLAVPVTTGLAALVASPRTAEPVSSVGPSLGL